MTVNEYKKSFIKDCNADYQHFLTITSLGLRDLSRVFLVNHNVIVNDTCQPGYNAKICNKIKHVQYLFYVYCNELLLLVEAHLDACM